MIYQDYIGGGGGGGECVWGGVGGGVWEDRQTQAGWQS